MWDAGKGLSKDSQDIEGTGRVGASFQRPCVAFFK